MKNKVLPYLITISVGLLMSLGLCFYFDIWNSTSTLKVMSNLSDIFFVPGALITCFGFLVAISDEGFFDLITYSVSTIFILFSKSKEERLKEKYIDYHERKKAERAGRTSCWFMVFSGSGFLVLCAIFTLLYYFGNFN